MRRRVLDMKILISSVFHMKASSPQRARALTPTLASSQKVEEAIRSPRPKLEIHDKAYCVPFNRVLRVRQIQSLLKTHNPLFKYIRFYCAESCCQAPLIYTASLNYFCLSQSAQHAPECKHHKKWCQNNQIRKNT